MKSLANHIAAGQVYRRADLAYYSTAIDRHLAQLTQTGHIQKLSHGLYYAPAPSKFGTIPPSDHQLLSAFLKNEQFLLVSPNDYNGLGLGLTQLYNVQWVYNHMRKGTITLADKTYVFKLKSNFPIKKTKTFLLIDLLNNLSLLAENPSLILSQIEAKLELFETTELITNLKLYGNGQTKKLIKHLLRKKQKQRVELHP